jgi:hypothetical protein
MVRDESRQIERGRVDRPPRERHGFCLHERYAFPQQPFSLGQAGLMGVHLVRVARHEVT